MSIDWDVAPERSKRAGLERMFPLGLPVDVSAMDAGLFILQLSGLTELEIRLIAEALREKGIR